MRNVDDRSYMEFLPTQMHQRRYLVWKEQMLGKIDYFVSELRQKEVKTVMEEQGLTPRDVALLVRLKYFTDDEIEIFGLREIEETVPA